MYIELDSSSSYPHVISVVGTFVGSLVLVVVLISGCVVCRRRQQKKDRIGDARNDQGEGEYQIPNVNIQNDGTDNGDGANVYTVPQPNIVYTDLDTLALKSGATRNQPNNPSTQYAIIDEEILNAARKQRQERHYANVAEIQDEPKPTIYANVSERNV